jgi:hypothetical protein
MSLPLPPKPLPLPPPAFVSPWAISKLGYNQLHLKADCVLHRQDVFRLIGELERIGATL